MTARSVSLDSRITEPEIDHQQRNDNNLQSLKGKMVLGDMQHNFLNNLYGRFDFQNYSLMRGFIDGKGKGVRLHYMKLQPVKKVASLCIFHGYGEHSSDYLQTADFYASNNIVVHMLDLRGFGLSGGEKQHDGLKELYYDVQTLLKCCQPSLPIYLFCHGFGSSLVMSLLTQNPNLPINGLIIVTPIFSFPKDSNSFRYKISSFICRQFLGDLVVNNHISATGITKNNFMVKKIIDAGCDFQYMKLRMIEQLETATEFMLENAHRINYPILMYSGAANILQDICPVQKYFASLSSKDKTFRCFSNGYHALHHDEEFENIKKHSIDWICERINTSKVNNKIFPLRIPLKNNKRMFWRNCFWLVSCIFLLFKVSKFLKKIMFKK